MRRPQAGIEGQAAIELILALLLILVPGVVLMGKIFKTEWMKSKCAYQSFNEARGNLIRTRDRSRVERHCETVQEDLSLEPLEALDGMNVAYEFPDLELQVSHFWDQFSSWQSAWSVPDSSGSGDRSSIGSPDKSSSTEEAATPPSW